MPRPRRLIIDAYNVLHVTGVLAPERAGPTILELARLVAGSRWGEIRTTLVCDGGAPDFPPTMPAGVEVVFAGVGREADDLIETMIARDSAPRSLRIISSDRRLQKAARRRRAGWMSSDAFLKALDEDAERGGSRRPASPNPHPPARGATEEWLDHFGIDSSDPILRLTAASGRDRSSKRQDDESRSTPGSPSSLPNVAHDPLIDEALREWRGKLDRADLDMRRWLDDVQPLDRPDEEGS